MDRPWVVLTCRGGVSVSVVGARASVIEGFAGQLMHGIDGVQPHIHSKVVDVADCVFLQQAIEALCGVPLSLWLRSPQ